MFSLSPRQCCSSLIKIKSNNIRQFIFQGLFTQREEDPSTRKILEGGNNFLQCYMQKFQSTWCPSEVEKGLKMEGDKNKNAIWALLLLTGIYGKIGRISRIITIISLWKQAYYS